MVACLTAIPNISQGAVIKYFSMLRNSLALKRLTVKNSLNVSAFSRASFICRFGQNDKQSLKVNRAGRHFE